MSDPLHEIQDRGFTVADSGLSAAQAANAIDYLAPLPIYLGGHVRQYASGGVAHMADVSKEWAVSGGHALACYDYEAVVRCPHLVEKALMFADLAEAYFGREPLLYSLNGWWAFPAGNVYPETQAFHRDVDDEKFLAVFFYLTDVSTDGPHEFIDGSHRDPNVPANAAPSAIYGPAGAVFLAHTYGYHRGRKPEDNPRLAAWARFGVSDPPLSYGIDKLHPVETDKALTERERRIARLVIS